MPPRNKELMIKKTSLALLACAAIVATTIGILHQAKAQGTASQILFTWQADTYVPDGFSGKVMPSSDSAIIAGIDLINMGKRVDLSAYDIFWYIDEKFYQGAAGLSRISFSAPHFIGKNNIVVRALIKNYPGGPGKTITIPVAVPEVVIQSSAPSLFASAAPFNLQAYPYFFNIQNPSQLNYSWSINNVNVGNQNPFTATRELADRGAARLKLSVSNPSRPIERMTKELTIFK
jgi:hypothetical protein